MLRFCTRFRVHFNVPRCGDTKLLQSSVTSLSRGRWHSVSTPCPLAPPLWAPECSFLGLFAYFPACLRWWPDFPMAQPCQGLLVVDLLRHPCNSAYWPRAEAGTYSHHFAVWACQCQQLGPLHGCRWPKSSAPSSAVAGGAIWGRTKMEEGREPAGLQISMAAIHTRILSPFLP